MDIANKEIHSNKNKVELKKIWDSTHDNRGTDDMNSQLKPIYTYSPRFEVGSQKANSFLDAEGYVIFKNVLNEYECEKSINLIWDYLENLGTGINRNDVKTWVDDNWPTTVHGGILSFHGIGQSDAQWYIRDRDNVFKAFSQIWGTDDLLTSFDGISLFRPCLINSDWKTNNATSWLHIDQHPIQRPGKQCIQGLVNLLPMDRSTGGNVLIPKSHFDFGNIPKKYSDRLSKIPRELDHFRYPPDDPLLCNKKNKPIMVHLEPGDLLLWDSRTIHCSGPGIDKPDESSLHSKHQFARAVSLVCMMPKKVCPENIRQRRKLAPVNLESSTNWCDRWVSLDQSPAILYKQDLEKYPNKNGYKYNIIPHPKLNYRQLSLVGYTHDEIQNNEYINRIKAKFPSKL